MELEWKAKCCCRPKNESEKSGSIRINELFTIDHMNETQIRKPVKQQSVARGVLLKNSVNSLMEKNYLRYENMKNYLRSEKGKSCKHVFLIVGFGYDEKYEKSQ
ncbi:unnamed protein product [Camellia sinensis]